jgi:hypothetical protein
VALRAVPGSWVAPLLLLACGCFAHAAFAQSTPSDTCSYRRCALAVLPVWNGSAIVRGESEERVGRLGFFWT